MPEVKAQSPGEASAHLTAGVVHMEAREEALRDGLLHDLEHRADERLAGDDGRQRGDHKACPQMAFSTSLSKFTCGHLCALAVHMLCMGNDGCFKGATWVLCLP